MADVSDAAALGLPRGVAMPGDGLRALVAAAAAGWRVMLLAMILALGTAVAGLRGVTPEYSVAAVIGPTARTGVAGMGARVPVTGGEASFGLAEPGASDETLSDFSRFLHLLTAVPVARRLMEDPGTLHRLFPERWDAAVGDWRPPGGVVAMVRRGMLAVAGREDWVVPDAEAVASWLRQRLVVEPVGTTPMRRLILRHADRAFALDLLGRVAALADDHLRGEAMRRSAAQIATIRAQLAVVSVSEHRRVLADLLADQERVQMMVSVDLSFAVDPIEPPSAPSRPDWPSPPAVLAAAVAAGLSLGIFLVTARTAWRGRRGE